MRITRMAAAGLLVPALLLTSASSARSQQSDSRPTPAPPVEGKADAPGSGQPGFQPSSLVYRPPLRGAPGGRVGGGSRGAGTVSVTALVPEGRALTSLAQPSLSWYLSSTTPAPVEVTISDDRAVKPVLEVRLPQPVQSGVQRIRLSDYGVKLEPGVQYKWFVTVVVDPARNMGQPTVTRSGVPTRVLARSVQTNGSVATVAHWFEVTPDEVRDAVEFERSLVAA